MYDPRLAGLPRILALSKADLVDAATGEETRQRWSERLGPDVPVMLTSSATRAGLEQLAAELVRRVPVAEPGELDATTEVPGIDDLAEHRVFRPSARRGYQVERVADGAFRVLGEGVERLLARYDLANEDALSHLERRLRGIGVIAALEAEGFEPGDDVEIAGVAFELDPSV
jgi:GTP-binding protein